MNMLSMLALKLQMILNREEGQDLIEYALLVGLISLAAVAAIGPIGSDLKAIYTSIANQLTAAN
ncbi:MAG: Flp family type IVb pilin [Acidobacteria bacterium]|nr:Flp family type IVb pilin [Acidobacteriota bacterium]